MTDWQSIPYDPCTEFSPFHHPELISNYKKLELETLEPVKRATNCIKMNHTRLNDRIIYVSVKFERHRIPFSFDQLNCNQVKSCSEHCNDNIDKCLHYILDSNMCIEESSIAAQYSSDYLLNQEGHYICQQVSDKLSFYSMCMTIYQERNHNLVNKLVNESLHTVHLQALQTIKVNLYDIAVNGCESANISDHQCYWIPNSIITYKHCSDCPPICRSLRQSLTFAQFCVGAALLMVSIPIAWVPVAALISDRVHREAQVGITYACM